MRDKTELIEGIISSIIWIIVALFVSVVILKIADHSNLSNSEKTIGMILAIGFGPVPLVFGSISVMYRHYKAYKLGISYDEYIDKLETELRKEIRMQNK